MKIIEAQYYKKYAIILHDEEIIENNWTFQLFRMIIEYFNEKNRIHFPQCQ
jgi:hypothetical protein